MQYNRSVRQNVLAIRATEAAAIQRRRSDRYYDALANRNLLVLAEESPEHGVVEIVIEA